MTRPMDQPPPKGSKAHFAEGFGQRFLLTVDTEEEFDWNADFTRDQHGLKHVGSIAKFQEFCEAQGVVPVYLVDWPIVNSPEAIAILKPAVHGGAAEVGVQLHPWVNPPFDEDLNDANSYAGNLPPELERAKFTQLRDKIEEQFRTAPKIYRAGRYGTGQHTAEMLVEGGISVDTSVRSNFDYRAGHGPDYMHHPLAPYWLEEERLLELPVTTVFWGMLRKQGQAFHNTIQRVPHLQGALAKLGLLERIPLTPEGTTQEEAMRGIDIALDDGLPVLVLSFHSPSLAPGHTPYVRSEADLDQLYEWFRTVFAYLRQRGVQPTTVCGIMESAIR